MPGRRADPHRLLHVRRLEVRTGAHLDEFRRASRCSGSIRLHCEISCVGEFHVKRFFAQVFCVPTKTVSERAVVSILHISKRFIKPALCNAFAFHRKRIFGNFKGFLIYETTQHAPLKASPA